MAYVAWDVITTPKEMGGLGLRSLKETNQALVLKMVWKITIGAEAQWVQALKSKYYLRGAFWSIQRRSRCSKLWKQIMELRPVMAANIAWKMGSGETIDIYSHPWFPGWDELIATTALKRREKVASLLDPITRSWNFEALQELFGFSRALQIATIDSIRPSPQSALDNLIFTFAKNRVFSVRKAYQLLKQVSANTSDRKFWGWVWKESNLTPKLKVFVWRCIHGAIPVMAVLAIRMRHLSSICPICKKNLETVMHALFHCEFAKRAWLVSPLPLRTEGFTQGFKETLTNMLQSLIKVEICSFVCMMWANWRMRNEVVYAKKAQSVPVCKAFYEKEKEACQLKIITSRMLPTNQQGVIANQLQEVQLVNELSISGYECYVDGAWGEDGKAGIGAYILNEGTIVWWISRGVQAINPNQAEAKEVLEGYRILIQIACGEGTVYSDSKEIVLALQNKLPVIIDWRSYEEIWAAWKLQSQGYNRLRVLHCGRENLRLEIAHRLAQQGKLYGWDTGGRSDPVFELQEMM